MKRVFTMAVFFLALGASYGCARLKRGNPVKANTNKIVYCDYSNSGLAIHTTVEIYRDSLVWDYEEMRNDCHLRDVVKYNPKDFDNLIATLSQIAFSAKDSNDYSSGGGGYSYSFSIGEKRYLSFNDTFKLSGDIDKLKIVISMFIKEHPTDAETLFRELAESPHEKAQLGEFVNLPKELEKYRIK